MAYIGDSCLKIGDEKLFVGDSISYIPNASITPEVVQVSVNSYARLDASGTYSDDELDVIDYVWSVSYSPHDSSVGITNALVISDEGRVASILLDKVGAYRISLTAKGAVGGCSQVAYANIVAVPFVSAHSDQTALDTSWIWQMLPSFWSKMDNVDRKRIETFWRGINQVVSSDLLEAYNIQANQSIASIQRNVIKRWSKVDLSFKPTSYKLVIRDNSSSPLTDIVKDGGFIKSASVQDGYNGDRLILCSATVISDSELYINKHLLANISGSDATMTFQLTYKNVVIRNKILLSSPDGLYTTLTLSNKLSSISQDIQIGATCNLEIYVKKNADIAYVVGEYSTFVSRYLPSVNSVSFINDIPSPIESQQFSVIKCSNMIIEDAEKIGVSVGDIIIITIRDIDKNYSTDVRLSVIGVDGNFVAINTYNTLVYEVDRILQSFESDLYSQDLLSMFMAYITSVDFLSKYSDIDINGDEYIVVRLDDSFIRRYSWSIRKVVRTKRVPIDKNVASFVKLVENIERTHLYDNKIILSHDYEQAVSRKPFDLVENLSFYLQPNK